MSSSYKGVVKGDDNKINCLAPLSVYILLIPGYYLSLFLNTYLCTNDLYWNTM